MFREMREGPGAVARTVEEAAHDVENAASTLRRLAERGVYRGFIIGSGTSFHASLFLQYLMNRYTEFQVTAVPAPEFSEWRPPSKNLFIIGFSQSGESSDIVEAFKIAREEGVETIAITNTPGSTLTRISNSCIVTRAGEEKAVAATKTFDVQLAAALMLTCTLAGRGYDEVKKAAREAEKVIGKDAIIRDIADRIKECEHAFCIGRSYAYPISLEAALKMKEAAMIHAEGFASREFLHGPVQLVDKGTPVIFFSPSPDGFRQMSKVVEKVSSYGAPILLVGPAAGIGGAELIEVAGLELGASAIPLVKAAQLLAYHLSVVRGLDPDRPSKLTKVVKYP